MTTARTRLLGLLGWPVEHSLSPVLHSAALAALGEDAVYVTFPVPPSRLADAVAGLRALGALGANVTLPHKTAVLDLADEVEPAAARIGAANTLVREGERWVAANTDAEGLRQDLDRAGVRVDGARVLVLGAGGAARAALVGLEGASLRRVAARRHRRASALRDALGGQVEAVPLTDAAALEAAFAASDVVVQATSATLGGGPGAEAFAAALPLSAAPAGATVVDLVYAPRDTAVLRAARACGLRAVDGLGMLVAQAALSLERWLGRPVPRDALRRAAEAALTAPEGG